MVPVLQAIPWNAWAGVLVLRSCDCISLRCPVNSVLKLKMLAIIGPLIADWQLPSLYNNVLLKASSSVSFGPRHLKHFSLWVRESGLALIGLCTMVYSLFDICWNLLSRFVSRDRQFQWICAASATRLDLISTKLSRSKFPRPDSFESEPHFLKCINGYNMI